MSKRIVTLDFLRGFSIIMIQVFHVIITSWDTAVAVRNGDIDPFSLPFYILILLILVFVFGYWRGLFLIVSSVVHIYSMTQALLKGKKPKELIGKQLLTGLFLIVWGPIVRLFLGEWGMIAAWADGNPLTVRISRMYDAGPLVNIGWAIIICSVIYLLLCTRNGVHKTRRNSLIFAGLGILTLLVGPLIYQAINNYFGVNLQTWGPKPPAESKFSFGYLILSMFVGVESPTLTALVYSFAGCSLGIALASPKVGKKTLLWGNLAGLTIFVIGGVLSTLKIIDTISVGGDIVEMADVHVHPPWFLLLMLGLQILALLLLLRFREFNKKLTQSKQQRILLFNRAFRRWGVLALTLYSFSVVQYFIRFALNPLTSQDLLAQGGASFGWTLIIIAVNFSFWTLLLYLWEKIGMVGSLEWILVKIAKWKYQREKKDVLNLQGVLYDVEPIMFVYSENIHRLEEKT
ncbi:MAG: hypothetical protein ACTSRE_12715 [Promethearchaeota archaeon]